MQRSLPSTGRCWHVPPLCTSWALMHAGEDLVCYVCGARIGAVTRCWCFYQVPRRHRRVQSRNVPTVRVACAPTSYNGFILGCMFMLCPGGVRPNIVQWVRIGVHVFIVFWWHVPQHNGCNRSTALPVRLSRIRNQLVASI